MKQLAEYFVKRPTLFWSLMVGIMLGGAFCFTQMAKLEDPAVAVKQAMVVVPYPGATAHEVELEAATVIEDQMRTIPGVNKVKSQCEEGIAYITVEFQYEVPVEEIEQRFDMVRRKVQDCASQLPQGCMTPIVADDMMDIYGMFYALSGKDYSPADLERYAKYLRRELLKVEGVKRISLYGVRQQQVNVTVTKENVSGNGITPMLIMQSLQGATKKIDAGKMMDGDENISIHVNSGVSDERDLADLMINTIDGKQVRLGDIAKVERGYQEPQKNGLWVNGKPAVGIMVSCEADAIVPDVGEAVDARLTELMKNLPAGMETDKVSFQPDQVTEAISGFMINLVESVLIVIIVLIFAMGWKSGVIIGFGLVLTIAASFPVLLIMGTTLQRISLGAFIVAMGMLVDNSIVIMDGILVDRARGLAPKRYLFDIIKKTAMPLLGATIIAASTLLAVYISKGTTSEYASDLFLVMCVSLLLSWLFAIIQVPMFAKVMYPARIGRTEQRDEDREPRLHRIVRTVVTWVLAHRLTSISAAIVALVVSMMSFSLVKNQFFSDFSYPQFVVEYYMPQQTSPDRVRDDLLKISQELQGDEDIRQVVVSTGMTPGRYSLVRPINSGGDYYGELIIDCKDYDAVCRQVPRLRRKLRQEYPDAYIRCRKYNFSVETSHTVEVEFAGPDPAVLRSLASQAEAIMRQCQYADPYSVQNNWKPTGKRIEADYIMHSGLRSGITRESLGNALQAAGDGMLIGQLNDHDTPLLVNLRVRHSDGSRIRNLNDVPVWGSVNLSSLTPHLLPLTSEIFKSSPATSVLRSTKPEFEEKCIMRLNGQRTIEAECDPDFDNDDATAAKVVSNIEQQIEAIPLPDGYSRRWLGEIELQDSTTMKIMKLFPITVFIIFVILLMLFNSWKKLGTILLCFPFVFMGIVPALILTHSPFTFMALLGFYGLVGMMIKNAIVLVDEITRLIGEERMLPYVAVMRATISRTRPVIMASLTTIVGMIPLLGDAMYGSMAVLIMSGLAMGTVITLVVVPLVYCLFYHIKTA